MPESPGNIEEIQNSLKASLGQGRSDIDQDVATASKRVLFENIAFQPASAPYAMQRDALRTKYISLNPGTMNGPAWTGDMAQQQQQGGKPAGSSSGVEKNGDSLPEPKVVLYPEDKVKMEWTRMTRIGAGLVNMGNTCFFNSTLQCLTYTAPLVNYCFTNDHREKCTKTDFCMMCEIQNHIKSSLDCGGRSIKPHSILQKLRCIAKHMKWGRQEDAHEFLRFVVDHLQQSCLNGETKLDRFSKETTVINQIFGGYLRSQVTCLRCQAKSNTFDPFMDLSLDIKGVNTVEEALCKFVKPETLEHENAYKCPKCKNKVRAQKRFSIQKAPNVLTLQLNRFDFHRHLSGKINRFIKYPEKINLRNFMSQRQGEPIYYHLYGVLVHSGHSSEHGHYYSYVKSPSKTWYCMNDSIVHQAGYNSVFSADAYVLFYARINKSSTGSASSTPNNYGKSPASPMKNAFGGPSVPSQFKQESPLVNGVHGKPSSELGTPIKRQQPSSSSLHPTTNGSKIVPYNSTATGLPGTHSKISFPILTPLQKKQHLQQQQQAKDDGKRIVLQIKHGNSTTMEKSPDGKSKVVNGGMNKQKPCGLVPYNDDSDSEQENIMANSGEQAGDKAERTSHQQVTPALSSHHAAGDFHHNHAGVRKLNFPSSNGAGDSRDVASVKSSSKHRLDEASTKPSHLYKDLPPSSSGSYKLSSTSKQELASKSDHIPNLHAKQSSDSLLGHASLKDLPHRELAPSISKFEDSHHISHPTSSSVPTEVSAGKTGHVGMELPVVNVSSSAELSSAKVKATGGNWLVQAQECAPSPRGSCSSANSLNSTTEWTVESKDLQTSSKSKTEFENGHTNMYHPHILNSVQQERKIISVIGSDMGKLKTDQLSKTSKHFPTEVHPKSGQSKALPSPQPARPSTPVDISDKHALLSPCSSTNSDNGRKKSKKHKKKHKKDTEEREYKDLRGDSSSRSDSSSSRKKKKHKHKKDKLGKKKNRHRSESDSDTSSYEDRKGKHKKHKYSHLKSDSSSSSDDDKQRTKKKREKEEDLDGYEWVEKTIETTAVRHSGSKSKSQVSTLSWNHHVKDDLAPRKDSSSDRVRTTWDGSRSSKSSLGLDGTSYIFGSSVLSWDGKPSQNDREVEEEEKNRRKRHWSDDYNQEIDAGRVKKTKKHTSEREFSSHNPFQQYHTDRHRNEHRDMRPSWSQDHSYYQPHQSYHSHKKSQNQWEKGKKYYSHHKYNDRHFKSYSPNSSYNH